MRRMLARSLLILAISMCLCFGSDCARAEDTPGVVQALPPIVVTGTKPSAKRGRAPSATRAARTMPRLVVYPTTPVSGSGSGIDPEKVPASVNIVDADQIKQTGSLNVGDALQKYVPGVVVNEVAGNSFQPNVQFRGFVGSPVSGTPQGLAVYQNGVRINEAFGDTVNWDLVPDFAINRVNLMSSNPVFGLNALGGALAIEMKNGFNSEGGQVTLSGGSFGRRDGIAEYGVRSGRLAGYIGG